MNRRFFRKLTCLAVIYFFVVACTRTETATARSQKTGLAFVVESIVLMLTVTGCGKKSSSSTTAITGTVMMGPLAGATITLKDTSGNTLATTTADANGSFSANIAPQSGPVIVTASGPATYTDEATNSTATVTAAQSLNSVVPDGSTSAAVPITPLTECAYQSVAKNVKDMTKVTADQMKTYMGNAAVEVGKLYGVDPAAITQVPANPFDKSATQNAASVAMVQYSQFLAQNNIAPASAMDATINIAKAFGTNGQLTASALPSAYQGLASAWSDPNKGLQAAAAKVASNTYVASGVATAYTNNSSLFTAPTTQPPNYVGAAVDYDAMKAAGGSNFKDPCDKTSSAYNAAACPSTIASTVTFGAPPTGATITPTTVGFSPDTYDANKATYNPTVVATGSPYTGDAGKAGGTAYQYTAGAAASTAQTVELLSVKFTGSPGSARSAVVTKADMISTPTTASTSWTYTITVNRYSGGSPTVVGTSSGSCSGFTSCSLTLPAGVQAGDYVMLAANINSNNSAVNSGFMY